MRPKRPRFILILLSGIAFGFLILPPLGLLIRTLQVQAWTELSDSFLIPTAIGLSLITTGISSLFIVIFGTPFAYLLARYGFRGKRIVSVLVTLPIVMPPAVAGLALLLIFGRRGLLGSPLQDIGLSIPFTTFAVILAQVFISAPFYLRSARVGFESIPTEIEEAGQVDGADGWTLFRTITLPLAWRAILAGLVLSWARALGEFGATLFFAGSLQGVTQTMPLLVYSVFERNVDAAIWTGILLLGLAVIALLIAQWLRRDDTINW